MKALFQNNEVLLLERILEKDDEIKVLRDKLDNFQNNGSLNHPYTCKFPFK